nr:isoform 2 of zinc finger protein zas1 [Quercus suber]
MDHSFGGYLYNQQQGQSSQQPSQGLSSFGNLSAAQQQHHQHDSNTHPTLPPLQQAGQNGGYSFGNLSYAGAHANVPGAQAHTSSTPHTPATSSMTAANAYVQMSPSQMQQNSMPPPSSFNAPYMNQAMMYQSSTSTATPPTTASAGLPNIRPMPPGGVNGGLNGLPSMPSAGQLGLQPAFVQNEEAPTHVVGSQGRRGVLPSAPGRPSAPTSGAPGAVKSLIPTKDADGKYPCPHCNKTYLHAKHLKRHLLRRKAAIGKVGKDVANVHADTGDRPYMCHLCKDTFSRSDILKRHFQKCSIRRGNPTGANHLAHQNRRNTNASNRLSMSQTDGPIGLAGFAEVNGTAYNSHVMGTQSPNGDASARSSRANSLISPGNMSQRGSVAGLGILGTHTPQNEQMATSVAYQQGMPAYSNQLQPNYAFNQQQLNGNVYANQAQQMSFLGQTSSRYNNTRPNNDSQNANGDAHGTQLDWSRAFIEGGQDGFVGGQPANASSSINIKTESDARPSYGVSDDMHDDSFLGSLYSHPSAFGSEYTEQDQGIPGFPNWSMDDTLQAKIDGLSHFCFPEGFEAMQNRPGATIVKACLTVENVKHFAEHYASYHEHWPLLHMPTFKLVHADNGLVMAIICIGAVYSPKLNVTQVRQMMEFVRSVVISNSSIHTRTSNGQTEGLGSSSWDLEELQALLMLQIMFTWHGDPTHRQSARNDFPPLVRIATAMKLCQTVDSSHYAYSVLHASDGSPSSPIDAQSFDWHSWLEQEKRNRALYMLYLLDAATVMWFNTMPNFDPFDISLMLPSDDAAWDARDQSECANALGLDGAPNQWRNSSGTRHAKQLGMREAMRTLLEPTAVFQAGATNAYSKFILIHAVVVRVITCQKVLLQPESSSIAVSFGPNGSGPATPLSQNDWLEHHGKPGSSSSGHATPTESSGSGLNTVAAEHEKKRLMYALDKWKRMWDVDMDIQYPPMRSQSRRFGFSRDGVHFFYLGRSFMQSQRATDWSAPPDTRFKQVMALLKRIKGFVVGDNELRGQEIGSVGDIDDTYGLDNLTLDMKLLFRPHSHTDHSVAGVQTTSL